MLLKKRVWVASFCVFWNLIAQTNPYNTDARLTTRRDIISNLGTFQIVAPRANSEQTVLALKKAIDLAEKFLTRAGVQINQTGQINLTLFDSSVDHLNFPEYLKKSCHPGWMNPSMGIFVVKSRVQECVYGNDFVHKLQKVLIHEIGHLVLWYLNKTMFNSIELNEGFATWFEHAVLGDSIPVNEQICDLKPSSFRGDFLSYIDASLHFDGLLPREVFGLVRSGDVQRLQRVYTKVRNKVCGR